MIRLLVITNNDSLEQPSFRQRVAIYLDLLRHQGIDCQVARLPRSPLARRTLFASARQFDGVLLHRKILNAWDGFWLRRCGKTVIYDFDDAIMYNDRAPGRISRIRFDRFGRTVALARLVIAGNEYLAEHARRYNDRVEILPTGLDLGPYRTKPPRGSDGTVRLVWIGAGSNMLRHVHGIGPALEKLGRRFPQVVLRLICNEFFGLQALRVEERRWSRDTEVADLATSDIGLAPMADDSFTRGKCGFKILQYQAAGLPVVASPVGVNGQYVQDGTTGFLVRDPTQWVEKLSVLIENPGLRTALGQAGQREVEKFDINVIGARLSRLIAECLATGNG